MEWSELLIGFAMGLGVGLVLRRSLPDPSTLAGTTVAAVILVIAIVVASVMWVVARVAG